MFLRRAHERCGGAGAGGVFGRAPRRPRPAAAAAPARWPRTGLSLLSCWRCAPTVTDLPFKSIDTKYNMTCHMLHGSHEEQQSLHHRLKVKLKLKGNGCGFVAEPAPQRCRLGRARGVGPQLPALRPPWCEYLLLVPRDPREPALAGLLHGQTPAAVSLDMLAGHPGANWCMILSLHSSARCLQHPRSVWLSCSPATPRVSVSRCPLAPWKCTTCWHAACTNSSCGLI